MAEIRQAGPRSDAPLRRLKKRSEFLKVQRDGVRAVRPGLVLQAAVRVQGGAPAAGQDKREGPAVGVGFTVTRRTGKAVVRNRIRRRLKAAAGELLPSLGRPGVDYVIIGRRAALLRPYERLTGDLRSALKAVHRALDKSDGGGSNRTRGRAETRREKAKD